MSQTPQSRTIAEGEGWRLREYVCRAGPGEAPFEERHAGVSIAAVAEGSFVYHGERGRTFMTPGALLLGNDGACFMCGHDHGVGDRCISLSLAPAFFAEIAATRGGSHRYRFAASHIPAARKSLPIGARLEDLAATRHKHGLAEQVIAIAEGLIAGLSGFTASRQKVSARDERRVAAAVRLIETNAGEAVTLDCLAAAAGLSKYHFLRLFRAIAGVTPHQYLLAMRLRRAATGLLASDAKVSAVAYDQGFGDLSTFNRHFRAHFGKNPSDWRRGGAS